MPVSKTISPKTQLIAMVHVPSGNALLNSLYNAAFSVETYTSLELAELDEIRKHLLQLSNELLISTANPLLENCRTASFVLKKQAIAVLIDRITQLKFVDNLIQRALHEVAMYYRNGIKIIALENVGAPYFIGKDIPFEELLILLSIALKIRQKYPEIRMGVQVLSCGELDALPIAMACGAFFVRSEASIFKGLRPEGETTNQGNLAKFYYLRNYLWTKLAVESPENRRTPALWCDLQKKHTVFSDELLSMQTWLNNILFQKLEGLIITGNETGANVSENDLAMARNALSETRERLTSIVGATTNFDVPLITGSGANFELYKRFADYCIVGTAFKKNQYWENEVDEIAVQKLVAQFNH